MLTKRGIKGLAGIVFQLENKLKEIKKGEHESTLAHSYQTEPDLNCFAGVLILFSAGIQIYLPGIVFPKLS